MLWTQEYRRWIRPGPVFVGLVALVMSGPVIRSQPLAEKEASPEKKRAALLLQRATYGPRPGDFAHILGMGTEGWLDEQLHPERVDDRKLDTKLDRFSDLELSTTELIQKYPRPSRAEQEAMQKAREAMEKGRAEAEASGERPDLQKLQRQMTLSGGNRPGQILLMMSEAKLVRAVESERQLQKVMTDFWFNHSMFMRERTSPHSCICLRTNVMPSVPMHSGNSKTYSSQQLNIPPCCVTSTIGSTPRMDSILGRRFEKK